MISALKKWAFKNSLKAHRNYGQDQNYKGVNPCKSICILAQSATESPNTIALEYTEKLKKMGKSVDLIHFFDLKSDTVESGYSISHIKWSGVPSNPFLDEWMNKSYDIFIVLTPELVPHISFISMLCNAKLKVGPAYEGVEDLFDVMIDNGAPENIESLIRHTDNTLQLLSR